jgi:hypothetical protein
VRLRDITGIARISVSHGDQPSEQESLIRNILKKGVLLRTPGTAEIVFFTLPLAATRSL